MSFKEKFAVLLEKGHTGDNIKVVSEDLDKKTTSQNERSGRKDSTDSIVNNRTKHMGTRAVAGHYSILSSNPLDDI